MEDVDKMVIYNYDDYGIYLRGFIEHDKLNARQKF